MSGLFFVEEEIEGQSSSEAVPWGVQLTGVGLESDLDPGISTCFPDPSGLSPPFRGPMTQAGDPHHSFRHRIPEAEGSLGKGKAPGGSEPWPSCESTPTPPPMAGWPLLPPGCRLGGATRTHRVLPGGSNQGPTWDFANRFTKLSIK